MPAPAPPDRSRCADGARPGARPSSSPTLRSCRCPLDTDWKHVSGKADACAAPPY